MSPHDQGAPAPVQNETPALALLREILRHADGDGPTCLDGHLYERANSLVFEAPGTPGDPWTITAEDIEAMQEVCMQSDDYTREGARVLRDRLCARVYPATTPDGRYAHGAGPLGFTALCRDTPDTPTLAELDQAVRDILDRLDADDQAYRELRERVGRLEKAASEFWGFAPDAPEPTPDAPAYRDRDGQLWHRAKDGQVRFHGWDTHWPAEDVAKRWGPLTPCNPDGTPLEPTPQQEQPEGHGFEVAGYTADQEDLIRLSDALARIAEVEGEREAAMDTVGDLRSELREARAEVERLRSDLSEVVRLIDKAGLRNLTNGVQLGQNSWFIKMRDALKSARVHLNEPTPTEGGDTNGSVLTPQPGVGEPGPAEPTPAPEVPRCPWCDEPLPVGRHAGDCPARPAPTPQPAGPVSGDAARCKSCAAGDAPVWLDEDGTLSKVSGRPGTLSHASGDHWWPCTAALASAPPPVLRVSREECIAIWTTYRDAQHKGLGIADSVAHALRTVLNRPGEPVRVEIGGTQPPHGAETEGGEG